MDPAHPKPVQAKPRSSLDEVSKFKTGEKKRPSWLTAELEEELDSLFFEIYPDEEGNVDWSITRPTEVKKSENVPAKEKSEESTFKVPARPPMRTKKLFEQKASSSTTETKVKKSVMTQPQDKTSPETETEVPNNSQTKVKIINENIIDESKNLSKILCPDTKVQNEECITIVEKVDTEKESQKETENYSTCDNVMCCDDKVVEEKLLKNQTKTGEGTILMKGIPNKEYQEKILPLKPVNQNLCTSACGNIKDQKSFPTTLKSDSNKKTTLNKSNSTRKTTISPSTQKKYPKRSLNKVDYSDDLFWDEVLDSSPIMINKKTPTQTKPTPNKASSTNKGNKTLISHTANTFTNNVTIKQPNPITEKNTFLVNAYIVTCKNQCCNEFMSLNVCPICNIELLDLNIVNHINSEHYSSMISIPKRNNVPSDDSKNAPINCEICNNEDFSQINEYLDHLINQHKSVIMMYPKSNSSSDKKQKDFNFLDNFICYVCNQKCLNVIDYIHHLESQHDCIATCILNYIYIDCKIKTNNENLDTINNIKCDDNYVCDYCKKSFHTKIEIKNHIEMNHIRIKCTSCKYQFINKLEYNEHIKTTNMVTNNKNTTIVVEYHYLGKRFKILCVPCNKLFINKYWITSHMKKVIHHTINNEIISKHICNLCKKSFDEKNELLKHIKIDHLLPKNIITCHSCNHKFEGKCKFDDHITRTKMTCPNEKIINVEYHNESASNSNYKILCKTCNKWCNSTSLMNKHIQIKHSKVTVKRLIQYKCPHFGCGLITRNSNALLRHLKNQHSQRKLYY